MTRPASQTLLAAVAFFLTALSVPAAADVIVLENGDTITGKVTRLERGVLTVTTAYSEPLSIQTGKVSRITTDDPVEVHLAGGEVVKGRLSSPEPGQVVLEPGEGRGAVTMSWGKVESVNPPPRLEKWSGNVSIGANSQSGNTDRTSVSVGAEAVKKGEIDRASFKLLYNYAEEGGSMSARNLFGSLKYDYYFTGKFYGYVSVEMLSDKFRDIKLRTVVGPGVGYQVWGDNGRSLRLELGAAYFSEDLNEGEDDSWATSRAAAELKWRFAKNLDFSDSLVLNNRLEEPSDYQLRNEAVLTSALGAGWALKVSNIVEYDSEPSAGIKSTDMFWILALQYAF